MFKPVKKWLSGPGGIIVLNVQGTEHLPAIGEYPGLNPEEN